MSERVVRIDYTNWRGERRTRLIRPTGYMEFANTEWHPDSQWLLEAGDVEDGGRLKQFALKDIHTWEPLHGADNHPPQEDRTPTAG